MVGLIDAAESFRENSYKVQLDLNRTAKIKMQGPVIRNLK